MARPQPDNRASAAAVAGRRIGAAVGLAISIIFLRGLWEAGLEGFAEGVGAGLGGVAVALIVTAIALVVVYMTLGQQVEAVATRLVALAAGDPDRPVAGSGGHATARVDGAVALIFAALGVWLAIAGTRGANASWTMLGFSALGLALLSLVSAITHARFERRRRPAGNATLDAARADKGGEIAGIFVSVAVLSLTLSSAIFAAAPRLRGETKMAAPRGDWLKICVGTTPGCERSKLLTITPERGRATLVEVISKQPFVLRTRGRNNAVDASGTPIAFKREPGTEMTYHARFMPAAGAIYEIVLDKPGLYDVRWRNAP